APPRARVLQERDEVGDPHYVYAGGPHVWIRVEAGEDHEPSVAPSPSRDLVLVDGVPLQDVPDGDLGVPDSVHPAPHVVQVGVPPAVPGAASEVRREDCEAETQEELDERAKAGPEL